MGALLLLIAAAYSSALPSFSADQKQLARAWTLDSKYIIELDPRTKAHSWLDVGRAPGVWRILSEDYWWPKGISGLFRPVVSLSYWLNWTPIVGGSIPTDIGPGGAPTPSPGADPAFDTAARKWWRLTLFVVVNLLSHFVAATLVYFVALHLTQRFWTSAFTAALFSVHPIAVESVTNIIGRADIFAAISVLGGLLLYARSVRSAGWRKYMWLTGLMLLTALGLFSKESAISVVLVIPLYDLVYRWDKQEWRRAVPSIAIGLACALVAGFAALKLMPQDWALNSWWRIALSCMLGVLVVQGQRIGASASGDDWRRPWRTSFGSWLFMLPPLLAMFFVRAWVFGHSTPPEEPFLDNPIRGVGWFAGRMTAINVIGKLWTLLLWPRTLSCDYSFNQVPTFANWSTAAGDALAWMSLAAVITVIALAVWLWKRSPAASFYIFFFFVTFFPTSNLLWVIGSIMAERFMYLPMVGFIGCTVLLVEWLARVLARAGPKQSGPTWISAAPFVVLGASVAGCFARTYLRNYDWMSDHALWTAAMQASPKSFRSYQSLAFAKYEEVLLPVDHRAIDTSIDEIIKIAEGGRPIVDRLPDKLNSSRLYMHLGMYYGKKGESLCQREPDGTPVLTPAARPWYRKSVEALERGMVIDRAFNATNRAKELARGTRPQDIGDAGLNQIYDFAGTSYLRLGDYNASLQNYAYFRHLTPADPEGYIKIGLAYAAKNDPENAAVAFFQALLLDPQRTALWDPIIQMFGLMGPQAQGALVRSNGNTFLDIQNPFARSVLCQAYLSFTRVFLDAKQFSQAELARQTAIEQYGLPQQLFDDLFKEAGRVVPVLPPNPATTPTR
ncbi:MAG: hypothetical protein ACREJC_02445 [Tepidisphaeraceae bacterium]